MNWSDYQQAGEDALSEGNLDEAQEHFLNALRACKSNPKADKLSAITDVYLGDVFLARGEIARAEKKLREARYALKVSSASQSAKPAHPGLKLETGSGETQAQTHVKALSMLGFLYVYRREFELALSNLEEAISMRDELEHQKSAAYLTDLSNMAICLEHLGHVGEAEALFRKVLTEFERTLGQDHPALVEHIANLARSLSKLGRDADAEVLNFRALDLMGNKQCIDHRSLPIVEGLIDLYMSYGNISYANADAALALCQRMLEAWKKFGRYDSPVYRFVEHKAERLASIVSLQKSEEQWHSDNYDVFVQDVSQENKRINIAYLDLLESMAVELDRAGRAQEAKTLHKTVKEALERIFGRHHPRLAPALSAYAENALLRDRPAKAQILIDAVKQNETEGTDANERFRTILIECKIADQFGDARAMFDHLKRAAGLNIDRNDLKTKALSIVQDLLSAPERERERNEIGDAYATDRKRAQSIAGELLSELLNHFKRGTETVTEAPEQEADYHEVMARIMEEHGLFAPATEYQTRANTIREKEKEE